MSVKSLFRRPVFVLSFFVFIIIFIAFGKLGMISEAGKSSALLPVTASIAQIFPGGAGGDVDGDGKADPGDTISYTVTVNNAGAGDATGVSITDQLQNELSLVAGSIKTTPIAGNDSYNVYGNVNIAVPNGGTDLLANDVDPDNGNQPTITTGTISSANCAGCNNVVISADGSFTYDPPVGFTGTDTFTYTVTGAKGEISTGTATMIIAGMIWFIDNNAAACTTIAAQCGKLTKKFSSIDAFRLINNGSGLNPKTNHDIFIYQSGTSYPLAATFPLLNGQRFIGQDASPNGTAINNSALLNITLPNGSATLPSTDTGGNAVLITGAGFSIANGAATTATLRGVNISALAASASKISGNVFGTFTLGDITLGGTGKAIDLTGGAVAIPAGVTNSFTSIASTSSSTTGMSFTGISGTLVSGGTTISGATTQGILIGTSPANMNFGNTTISATTDGISFQNNSGGTRTFGTLSTTNGTGVGFLHGAGGGAVTVTGAATFTNPGGRCIDIQDSTTAVAFANVTATQCGGTGVFLDDNSGNVTFADLDITSDSGQRGLQAQAPHSGTITTTSGTISTTNATAIDIAGTSAASKTPLNMTLTSVSVSGSASGIMLTNTSSTGSPGGFKIVGSASTAASGGTISNISGADGSTTAGIGVYLDNVSDITLTNMTFSGAFGNFGIRGENVTNFTLRDSSLGGTFGTNESIDEGTIRFGTESLLTTSGIKGTALFEGNTIGGGYEHNLSVFVYGSDTLNMTVQDSASDPAVFNLNGTALGDDALHLESGGNGSNLTLTVNGVLFNGARGDQLGIGQIGVTTQTLTITNNQFHNTHTNIVSGGGGVWILGGSLANTSNVNVTYNFSNNSIKNSQGDCFRAVYTGYAATISGLILNNTIGTNNGVFETNTNGGSVNGGDGISVGHAKGEANSTNNLGTINHAVRIEGNTIRDIKNGTGGIRVTNGSKAGGTSRLEATIKNNTVAEVGGDLVSGLYSIVGGTGAGDISQTGLVITGNSFTAGPVFGDSAIYLDQILTSVGGYYIPGYTITANSNHGESAPPAGGTASTNLEAFWVPQNGTLTNGPTAFMGKKVNAQNTKNITNNAFVLAVPSIMPPAEEGANQTSLTLDRYLDFQSISNQTHSEMIALIKPIFRHSADSKAITNDVMLAASGEVISIVKANAELTEAGYFETAVAFFSEVADKLESSVSPTIFAQKRGGTSERLSVKTSAPLAGETITIDGAGAGFTIPAGKSLTVTFKATVNNGPFPAGVGNISNNANVTGSPAFNITTNTVSLALDAAPNLKVTTTDLGTSTQPGSAATYTINYDNLTSVKTQNATGVVITHVVPANTTFNAGLSTGGWSCADGAVAGTSCTITVGALNAGGNGTATFAVNVLDALPSDVVQVAPTVSIADDGANGTDLNAADNTGSETTAIVGNWLGDGSSNWFSPANWSSGVIPPPGNNISIPTAMPTAANRPQIPAAGSDVSVGKLTFNGGNLNIDTGRTLTASGQVTLGANIVDGAGTLALGAGSVITRSTGQVESTLKKIFGGAGTFTFPVGTAGAYSPVNVTVTAGAGDLSVKANAGTSPATPPINDATTLDRYWTLEGSGITSDITFNYLQTDVDGNEAVYNIIRSPSGGGAPVIRYAPNGTSIILDTTGNFFTVKGLQSYSNWTAGEPVAPTAATVNIGGRIVNANGVAVSNAQISMVDADGNVRIARTNPFGYYRITSVSVGSTYTLNVRHKFYEFEPRVLFISEESDSLDFVANP